MKKIKTFLVDDEIGALTALMTIIETESPELDIIGTARSVQEAYQQIKVLQPELIFLDIQLRDQTGFDLLNLPFDFNFEVIFVTAYDQYAIEAFNKNALSYLLKPISFDSIQRVKDRAIKFIRSNSQEKSSLQKARQLFAQRIALPDSTGVEYIDPKAIICIEADGSYCKLHLTEKRKKTLSRPLKYIEDQLPKEQFLRIHRSYLINIGHIQKWDKTSGGSIILGNQMNIPVSRSGRKLLAQIMH